MVFHSALDLYRAFPFLSKSTFALFNLYVPVNYLEKKECWLLISKFLELNSPSNIILASDLNITLAPNENKGGMCGRDHLQETVEELILDWDSNDLKLKSGRFTWSNHRVGAANIFARLDHFLVHSYLLDGKSILFTKILPKISQIIIALLCYLKKKRRWVQFPSGLAHFGSKELDSWKWFLRLGLIL